MLLPNRTGVVLPDFAPSEVKRPRGRPKKNAGIYVDPDIAKPPEVPQSENAAPSDATNGLPGFNPYDAAVRDGIIDYQMAKTREEVLRVREVTERERIATEQARIALEKDRVSLDLLRGALITKEDNHARLSALASAFNELLRLAVSESAQAVPASNREAFEQLMQQKCTQSMEALAEAVAKRVPTDKTNTMLLEAFSR